MMSTPFPGIVLWRQLRRCLFFVKSLNILRVLLRSNVDGQWGSHTHGTADTSGNTKTPAVLPSLIKFTLFSHFLSSCLFSMTLSMVDRHGGDRVMLPDAVTWQNSENIKGEIEMN